jgi:hypothetical protein
MAGEKQGEEIGKKRIVGLRCCREKRGNFVS